VTPSQNPNWPPQEGQTISFHTKKGIEESILKEVREGLVWRDFLLEDGRMIAEHRVIGCPDTLTWRDPDSVSAEERTAWEARLILMAETSIDPWDREQPFWADLTHYIAYTYLRFTKKRKDAEDAA
jgi:hypothetical protein